MNEIEFVAMLAIGYWATHLLLLAAILLAAGGITAVLMLLRWLLRDEPLTAEEQDIIAMFQDIKQPPELHHTGYQGLGPPWAADDDTSRPGPGVAPPTGLPGRGGDHTPGAAGTGLHAAAPGQDPDDWPDVCPDCGAIDGTLCGAPSGELCRRRNVDDEIEATRPWADKTGSFTAICAEVEQ